MRLRVKVRGRRDLVTVLGSAAELHAGESIQASGQWQQHREHGLEVDDTATIAVYQPTSTPTATENSTLWGSHGHWSGSVCERPDRLDGGAGRLGCEHVLDPFLALTAADIRRSHQGWSEEDMTWV